MQHGFHKPDQEVLEIADCSITGSNFLLFLLPSYESSPSFYKRTCSQLVLCSYMSYLTESCCRSLLMRLGKPYCSQNTEAFLFFFQYGEKQCPVVHFPSQSSSQSQELVEQASLSNQ